MVKVIPGTSFALAAILRGGLAGTLNVKNSCPFTIWCSGAKNGGGSSGTVQVDAGSSYTSPLAANNDNIGAVLKCATNSALANPYQLEMTSNRGKSWLDLSNQDGHPFLNYHRAAKVLGSSCALDCPAGSTACEWPFQVDCISTASAWMYPC